MSESSEPGTNQTLYCSFCGRPESEVFTLLAGPQVFICDLCVDVCAGIMAEEKPKDSEES